MPNFEQEKTIIETAIEFRNISKSYEDKIIISNFNLSIKSGEFVTIVGQSGSGKTTILKMINALIRPTSGDIFIHNENINTKNIIELRRNIGYAIQGSVLFPHMNVEENISYVPNLLNKKDVARTKKAVEKWMKIVGLEHTLKSRFPHELSGGQQQRVGIARALAASPDILLMDEPFGAVDEITRTALQNELLEIYKKTKITILFVTHDIKEALKLGSKTLVMSAGNIEQYASPEEILKNPASEYVERLIGKNAKHMI